MKNRRGLCAALDESTIQAATAEGLVAPGGPTTNAIPTTDLPPDPAGAATEPNPTTTTTAGDLYDFLRTGPDAVQTGVAPEVLDEPHRTSLVCGTLQDRDGGDRAPLRLKFNAKCKTGGKFAVEDCQRF